jgi:CheY-like chemotaxis protein
MSTNPVVYFIDDSATMREVIKIAFRRENLEVIACHDAASAIAQMEETAPDVVISDVIMPEKDGYEVCQHIKQHQRFGRTPVILMSGVVNRSVAERAFAVKADELIRKPFQPQDLITRVRHLLNPKAPAQPAAAVTAQATATAAALSSIFATPASSGRPMARVAQPPVATMARPVAPIAAPAIAYAPPPAPAAPPQSFAQPATAPPPVPRVPQPPASGVTMDVSKMRMEIMRLQSQIKKLESELAAEREYSHALEEHIKTLQETE